MSSELPGPCTPSRGRGRGQGRGGTTRGIIRNEAALWPERMAIFPGKAEEIRSRALGFLPRRQYLGRTEVGGLVFIADESGKEAERGVNLRRGGQGD